MQRSEYMLCDQVSCLSSYEKKTTHLNMEQNCYSSLYFIHLHLSFCFFYLSLFSYLLLTLHVRICSLFIFLIRFYIVFLFFLRFSFISTQFDEWSISFTYFLNFYFEWLRKKRKHILCNFRVGVIQVAKQMYFAI